MLETGFWTYFSHFCSYFIQNHILIEVTRHIPTFWNSSLHGWLRNVLKKMAYNTFLAVSVRLVILRLLVCLRAYVLSMLIKIDPCLVTSYETIKTPFFWYFGYVFSSCFAICTLLRFCSSVSKWELQQALKNVFSKWSGQMLNPSLSFVPAVWQWNAHLSQ